MRQILLMRRIWLQGLTLAVCAAALISCSHEQGPATEIYTYNMGEQAHSGRLAYTVFERQWLTQIGSGIEARMPQNRFYLVRISAMNSGSSDAVIPTLNLVDDAGNTYPELSNGDGVQGWLGYL